MKPAEKLVSMIPPQAIKDNASWTCAAVDCRGFGHARIIVYLGATDIALAALTLTESDNDSDYSNVTGAIVGTSQALDGSASNLPSATDDNKFWIFDVDLRGRKRYLKLTATAGDGTTGTYLTALAILSQPEVAPDTTAEMGAAEVLTVPSQGT